MDFLADVLVVIRIKELEMYRQFIQHKQGAVIRTMLIKDMLTAVKN